MVVRDPRIPWNWFGEVWAKQSLYKNLACCVQMIRLKSTIQNANNYETTTPIYTFQHKSSFPNMLNISTPLQVYLSSFTCESAKGLDRSASMFSKKIDPRKRNHIYDGCEWQASSLNVSAEQMGVASLWTSIWREQIGCFYWCRSSAILYNVLHLTLTVKLFTAQVWDKGAFIDAAHLLLEVPEHSRGIWDLCVCTR